MATKTVSRKAITPGIQQCINILSADDDASEPRPDAPLPIFKESEYQQLLTIERRLEALTLIMGEHNGVISAQDVYTLLDAIDHDFGTLMDDMEARIARAKIVGAA